MIDIFVSYLFLLLFLLITVLYQIVIKILILPKIHSLSKRYTVEYSQPIHIHTWSTVDILIFLVTQFVCELSLYICYFRI